MTLENVSLSELADDADKKFAALLKSPESSILADAYQKAQQRFIYSIRSYREKLNEVRVEGFH